MPNAYSVTGRSAGDQVSSGYEGRHLTFYESELAHPSHEVDGVDLVQKGDPVLVGDVIVGVALKTALATTDLIAIDTEGIWVLAVDPSGMMGPGTVDVGDAIYITDAAALVMLNAAQLFGYALTPLPAGEVAANVIVKVHWGGFMSNP